jgi:DNA-binding NarL/FixJ family response regulator
MRKSSLMKQTMKTRIMVVDDHRMYRDGLKALLSRQNDMEIVGEAENGQEAIARTRKLRPDVILMDVKMPVMDGVEATRRILAEMPDMKILALTMCSEVECKSGIMRAGARGYILKGGDFEELTAAIRKETMKTRILIVDDHQVYRDGLKAMLARQNDMEVVGEAENGLDAVTKAREHRPDVILMDVNMSVMDGAEATSRILAELPSTKILALSIQADDGFMSSMLRAGAMGYVLKGCDSEKLFDIIRRTAGSPNS